MEQLYRCWRSGGGGGGSDGGRGEGDGRGRSVGALEVKVEDGRWKR